MKLLLGLLLSLVFSVSAWAQSMAPVPVTPVQALQGYYSEIPISATAAANAQTTLTIPAPPSGLYNYVCSLTFNYSQTNTTGTVQSNAVTTSPNFNGFAIKFSAPAAINTNYDWSSRWGDAAVGGCPKSTSPAIATTFVSPSAATNGAFTWTATYFQAP